MSVPSLVPVFDIEAFDGYQWEFGFQIEHTNADGTSQTPDPVYEDLTGKEIVLIIEDIFASTYTLSSDDSPDDNGSSITFNADPATGIFSVILHADQMALARNKIGYHRFIQKQTGVPDKVLLRGTFSVVPFNAEGEI